ncbi:uncharacterized protein OCT59_008476 [Rhizophagus irregularis]|uniref:uncharacterized protein n=1 Tax=Rhizophagus irregularis TaxID=588596 RepID=UPI000CACDC8E|nr:hypothetical protein OCT59_004550 [Rhizophagus irregularis]UZO17115.1 hypothetical protein OCT59_008476 [Rhizophagus irregularis]
MAINREILKSCQTPHTVSAIPELVGHILEYIPSSNFGPHLLEVNPIWRAEAERVLWKRRMQAEEAYEQVANICKKAERAFWRDCADGGINFDKLDDESTKISQEKYTRFEEMVVIEQAILHCSFISEETNKGEYIRMMRNFELFKDGDTPDEDAFGDSDDDDSDDEE